MSWAAPDPRHHHPFPPMPLELRRLLFASHEDFGLIDAYLDALEEWKDSLRALGVLP